MSEHIRVLAPTDRKRLLQDLVQWVSVEPLDKWQFRSALQLATEFDAENVIDGAVDTVSHGRVPWMPLELVAAIARHPTPSGRRWLAEIVRGAGTARSREDRHLAIRAWIAAAVTAKPRGAEPELAKALELLRTWSDVGITRSALAFIAVLSERGQVSAQAVERLLLPGERQILLSGRPQAG
jgi:hypothetical protein